jgi:hypothetical protein
MLRNGRRLLYSPAYVEGYRRALQEAHADLADMSFKSACRHADLMRELDKCRAELDELRAMVLARHRLDAELVGLYRERELQRATRAQRDPSQRLQ